MSVYAHRAVDLPVKKVFVVVPNGPSHTAAMVIPITTVGPDQVVLGANDVLLVEWVYCVADLVTPAIAFCRGGCAVQGGSPPVLASSNGWTSTLYYANGGGYPSDGNIDGNGDLECRIAGISGSSNPAEGFFEIVRCEVLSLQ